MNYTIDAVARLTGISAFTLRNWEKRYDFLRPPRMENGFRKYDEAHIELLRRMAALIKRGAKIGDLAQSVQKGRSLPEIQVPDIAPEVLDQTTALHTALMAYDLERADKVHAELAARFSMHQLLDLIYFPLLSTLGKDWLTGSTSIAQEHFASAFIRLRLAPYLTLPISAPSGNERKKILCATLSGELHEGGLMLIAAHLRLRGWVTYYLGSNVPIDDLTGSAQAIKPHIICLSFSDPHALENALPRLAQIRGRICIGGFGALTFDGDQDLPPHIHLSRKGGKEAADTIEMLERGQACDEKPWMR